MKKISYTLAFVALFSAMSYAQTSENSTKQEPAKAQAVNADGTISPAPAVAVESDNVAQPTSATEHKAEEKPKNGTRMAITEKGVPASKKPAEAKKEEPAKAEKH